MITHLSHVTTLANGIIGVSVLAMPFCFKQCGIILSILMLFLSSVLSRLACHFLVKSAVMSRRRNFEFLALHAFGHTGKFLAELFIIGFLMGTCIAFFVVVGDLGPQIVGKMFDRNPEDIRTSLLVTIGIFIILPLGLLKNIDSLSTVCTATIGFYLCLVLKVMAESTTHIFAGDWYDHVTYWRPTGILQCLPIFSMALFCQTQLFEIYETVPNVCLDKMNQVVRSALNICTVVYIFVGFFGYVAFCTQPFTGNILMSFEPSVTSEAIKLGFVLSIAFSFPLVIFPCRASLNSLLFHRVHSHETSGNYIPENKFRCLTFIIVGVSLITGILIPNIEFVLGLVGSTIGVMICLMFPAAFFISISSKNTNERLVAQIILFVGAWIMILGTYANLYAMEESANTRLATPTVSPLSQLNNIRLAVIKNDIIPIIPEIPNRDDDILRGVEGKLEPPNIEVILKEPEIKDDTRREPPIPVERVLVIEKPILVTEKSGDIVVPALSPVVKEIVEEIKKIDSSNKGNLIYQNDEYRVGGNENAKEVPVRAIETKDKTNEELQKNDNLIHSDAIKKEDSELAENGELAMADAAEKHEELRNILEKYNLERQELIREHKKAIEDLREHKREYEKEKKEKLAIKKLQQLVATNDQRKGDVEIKKNARDVPESNPPKNPNDLVDSKSTEKLNVGPLTVGDVDKIVNKQQSETQSKIEQFNRYEVKKSVEVENQSAEKGNEHNPGKAIKEDSVIPNAIQNEIPNVNILKASDTKVPGEIINSKVKVTDAISEKSRGPILNALTKRNLKNKSNNNTVDSNNNIEDKLQSEDDKIEKVEENEPNEIAMPQAKMQNTNAVNSKKDQKLPIVLVMNNKTESKNNPEELPTVNKSEDGMMAIRRDILENHERQKRDAEEVTNGFGTEKIESLADDIAHKDDKQNCAKPAKVASIFSEKKLDKLEEKVQEDEKSKETGKTEHLLIKTNAYLSDQRFTDKFPLDTNFGMNVDFAKPKQRGLKSVDPDNSDKA